MIKDVKEVEYFIHFIFDIVLIFYGLLWENYLQITTLMSSSEAVCSVEMSQLFCFLIGRWAVG